MIIPIDTNLRIRGTEECWRLEKSKEVKGETRWEAFKYFTDLGRAMGEACRREIRLHPAQSLSEAIKAADQITTKYSRIFDEALDVVESRRAA